VKPGPFFVAIEPVPQSPPPAQPLLDHLAVRYPTAKRQTLRRMLQAGRVTINGRVARDAKAAVSGDDRVTVADHSAPPPTPSKPRARPQRLSIVHEDADVLVVDKPAGLLTSTVPREPRPTLLAMVREHVESNPAGRSRPARVGLIHRLDRDASGLLVFSKSHEAYLSLKQQFFKHSVERVYTAVVIGIPTPRSGKITSRLVERADGTVYSTAQPGKGERAVTEYVVQEERRGRALVRVTLHTGRKHQIRVHLSDRGTPIVGDTMYGRNDGQEMARKSQPPGRLMLTATKLSFDHPWTGERVTFELPVPEAFAAAIAPKAATQSR
jgi:23S rRNA pseudouridine1911/1915/1917 synthase